MPPPHAAESRAATNDLLAQLRAGRWRPRAWLQFLARASRRSADQALRRPRALAEVSLLHIGIRAITPSGRRHWTLCSWLLAATHLGLLGRRGTLGAANVITLLRANLPGIPDRSGRWLPAVAASSDLLDGWLARRTRTETTFGAHADSLADAAFWTWYALHHERSPAMCAAALATWAGPVAAVSIVSVRRGHMIDPPSRTLVRPAAVLQAVLAVRALRTTRQHGCPVADSRGREFRLRDDQRTASVGNGLVAGEGPAAFGGVFAEAEGEDAGGQVGGGGDQ